MPPINDELSGAIVLELGYHLGTYSNVGASTSAGELALFGSNYGPAVWFSLTNGVPSEFTSGAISVVYVESDDFLPYFELYHSTIPNPTYADLTFEAWENGPFGFNWYWTFQPGRYYWGMVTDDAYTTAGIFRIKSALAWGGNAVAHMNSTPTTSIQNSIYVRDTQKLIAGAPLHSDDNIIAHDDMTDTLNGFIAPTGGLWNIQARYRASAPTMDFYLGWVRNGIPIYPVYSKFLSGTGAIDDYMTDDWPKPNIMNGQFRFPPNIRLRTGDEITFRAYSYNPAVTRYPEISAIVFEAAPIETAVWEPNEAPAVSSDIWAMSGLSLGNDGDRDYNISEFKTGYTAFDTHNDVGDIDICVTDDGNVWAAWVEDQQDSTSPFARHWKYPLKKWNGSSWTTITDSFRLKKNVPMSSLGGSIGSSLTTANLNPPMPAGYAVGDLLIVFGFIRNSATINTPAGWTQKATWTRGTVTYYVWYKRAASLSEGFNATVSGSGDKYGRAVYVNNAIASGDPFDSFTTNSGTTQAGTLSSITTTVDNCGLLAWVGNEDDVDKGVIWKNSPTDWGPRSYFTSTTGADAGISTADGFQYEAGSVQSFDFEFDGQSRPGWGAFLGAIKPGSLNTSEDFFVGDGSSVSIDTDGEDIYIAFEEEWLGNYWRCVKYDVSADQFIELGNKKGQFYEEIFSDWPYEAGFPDDIVVKVSPAGVPWVAWAAHHSKGHKLGSDFSGNAASLSGGTDGWQVYGGVPLYRDGSGNAYSSAPGTLGRSYRTDGNTSSYPRAVVTLTSEPATNDYFELWINLDTANNNGYLARITVLAGADKYEIFKVTGGTETLLGSTIIEQEVRAGDSYEFINIGGLLDLRRRRAGGSSILGFNMIATSDSLSSYTNTNINVCALGIFGQNFKATMFGVGDKDWSEGGEGGMVHVWYWNGSAWIDSGSLLPPNVRTSDYYEVSVVSEAVHHIDITFCHHDGPSEYPSAIYNIEWNTTGANSREFIYAEYNGSSWTNFVQTRAGLVFSNLQYPDSYSTVGHWHQGLSLTNNGNYPIMVAALGTGVSDFDLLVAGKFVDLGSGVELVEYGLPGKAAYGYQYWDGNYSGPSAVDDFGNLYILQGDDYWEKYAVLVDSEIGNDKGFRVASTHDSWVELGISINHPSIAIDGNKIYVARAANWVLGVWEMEYTNRSAIDLSKIRFRAYTSGDA